MDTVGGRWALVVFLAIAAAPCVDALDGEAHLLGSAHFLAAKEPTAIVAEALRSAASGSRNFVARQEALQTRLRSLFRALPKTASGSLAPEAVRYALHRHFVREHAMYIHGLEPAGTSFWNDSSPVDALSQRVPADIQMLFSERLESHGGFDLNHLALFAATLESLIHEITLGFLREAYAHTNHSTEELLTVTEIDEVTAIFFASFLSHEHRRVRHRAPSVEQTTLNYPGFVKVLKFVRQKQLELLRANVDGHSFTDVSRVVDGVISELGQQQQDECDDFTDDLIKIGVPGTGRVKLSKFYATRFLDEPPELLRNLGALDEDGEDGGQQTEPHVVIPNYISSSTNCISSTQLYAVCCPDACDPLLTRLEEHVRGPLARPLDILSLVQTMPSRTQEAPRQLGETLVKRLEDIAEANEGKVPLHGRLFAQWMHFAYPYECTLPARIGTTTHVASKDFARLVTDRRETFTSEKVGEYLRDYASAMDLEGGDFASTVLWQTEEIHFLHSEPSLAQQARVLTKALAFSGALFAAAHVIARSIASPISKAKGSTYYAV